MPRARKIAGTAGKIALAATGVGAVALGASALAKRRAQKKNYTIDRWNAIDGGLVAIHYTPAIALAKSDRMIITGTPFDGEYKPTKAPTRNDVQIKPSQAVSGSGTSGSFKVKTGTIARLKGAVSATKAGVRTGIKKTAGAIGKGIGMLWAKLKWYIIGAVVVGLLFILLKSYIMGRAMAGAPQPTIIQTAPPAAPTA